MSSTRRAGRFTWQLHTELLRAPDTFLLERAAGGVEPLLHDGHRDVRQLDLHLGTQLHRGGQAGGDVLRDAQDVRGHLDVFCLLGFCSLLLWFVLDVSLIFNIYLRFLSIEHIEAGRDRLEECFHLGLGGFLDNLVRRLLHVVIKHKEHLQLRLQLVNSLVDFRFDLFLKDEVVCIISSGCCRIVGVGSIMF